MCMVYPPSFQGGDEITEILALDVEKPITEDIARQDRQLGPGEIQLVRLTHMRLDRLTMILR